MANMSGPRRSIEEVLGSAVEQVAVAQQWSHQIAEEVATAVVDRLDAGKSPGGTTFLTSLTAPSSWIVDDKDIDPAQHAGAGSFIQPVAQAPIPGDGLAPIPDGDADDEPAPAFIGFDVKGDP